MTAAGRLRTLVLTRIYAQTVSYYDSWQAGLADHPRFDTRVRNLHGCRPRDLEGQLGELDVVVLLHSCTADTTDTLAGLAPVLAGRKGCRLVAFVGNEFNSPHAPLADKIAVLKACRPDLLATQLLPEAGRHVYEGVAGKVVSVPHALDVTAFADGPDDARRPIDIGFRGFRYSPLIGDQERDQVVNAVLDEAGRRGLATDVSWRERLDQQRWAAFLGRCRGTVGCEAGSWFLDRDDALVRRIYAEVESQRRGLVITDSNPLRRHFRALPGPLKRAIGRLLRSGPIRYAAFEDETLEFAPLQARYFTPANRAPVYTKCISSRHFEAAGTGTCQILLAGRYNDILRADEHYIAVKPDLSDVAAALERFADPGERRRIAAAARDLVRGAHTYAHRIGELHAHLTA